MTIQSPRREPLSHQLAVRFRADEIEALRRFSVEEDLTVSAWIRRIVLRTLRQSPPNGSQEMAPTRPKSRADPDRRQIIAIRFRDDEAVQIERVSYQAQLSMDMWLHRVVCRVLRAKQARRTNGAQDG
jgi:hypothetical protein